MVAEWFYQDLGQVVGPVTSDHLRQSAREGRVGPETLVRRGPSGKWVAARKVKGLCEGAPTGPPPLPPPPLPRQRPRWEGRGEERTARRDQPSGPSLTPLHALWVGI